MLRVLDCLALAIPVGQIIGRCANIINGDTWGSPTRLPWGFVYTNPHALLPANLLGVPTHPTPVYEQLWLVVMVAILWYAVPRLKTDGMAILLYLGLYSFGRFFISFYRVNNILLLGLREAQLVALVVLVRGGAGGIVAAAPDAAGCWGRGNQALKDTEVSRPRFIAPSRIWRAPRRALATLAPLGPPRPKAGGGGSPLLVGGASAATPCAAWLDATHVTQPCNADSSASRRPRRHGCGVRERAWHVERSWSAPLRT